MNREIKFRAWDGDKMISPDSVTHFVELDGTIWMNHGTVEYDKLEQQPCVQLMQFTGLKDKNGKEIYEGDVVNGRYGLNIVGFIDAGFHPLCGDINAEKDMSLIEVIGNIYEHPELLNQKTQTP